MRDNVSRFHAGEAMRKMGFTSKATLDTTRNLLGSIVKTENVSNNGAKSE